MQNILTNFKRMNLFQKIQVLSGIIPPLSTFLVIITSYIYTCKTKKWLLYCAITFPYFLVASVTWSSSLHFVVRYIICFLVSITGNYLLVSYIQLKKP